MAAQCRCQSILRRGLRACDERAADAAVGGDAGMDGGGGAARCRAGAAAVLDAAAGAETIGLVKTGLVTTGALTTAAGAELTSMGLAAVALDAGGTSETCGRTTVGVACAASSAIVASGL